MSDLEVQGPAGFKARLLDVKPEVVMYFILIILVLVLMWMIYQDQNVRAEFRAKVYAELSRHETMDRQVAQSQIMVRDDIGKVAEEQKATTYVLTLTQKEREALKLDMPRALLERVRR